MTKSESLSAFAKDFCAMQGELQTVKKDSLNPFFKSKYADISAFVEMLRPIMTRHNLSFMHVPNNDTLECIILHSSGEFVSGQYPIRPKVNDPQGVGAAITYAKRYSLGAMTGAVSADEDDDGEGAMDRDGKRASGQSLTVLRDMLRSAEFSTWTDFVKNAANFKAQLIESDLKKYEAEAKKRYAELKKLHSEKIIADMQNITNVEHFKNWRDKHDAELTPELKVVADARLEQLKKEFQEKIEPKQEGINGFV